MFNSPDTLPVCNIPVHSWLTSNDCVCLVSRGAYGKNFYVIGRVISSDANDLPQWQLNGCSGPSWHGLVLGWLELPAVDGATDRALDLTP